MGDHRWAWLVLTWEVLLEPRHGVSETAPSGMHDQINRTAPTGSTAVVIKLGSGDAEDGAGALPPVGVPRIPPIATHLGDPAQGPVPETVKRFGPTRHQSSCSSQAMVT